jgi:hypothetical protein
MRTIVTKRSQQRGSALIEISVSYAALTIVSLLILKASVNSISTQNWTVKQSLTDAYITRESALASRVPFADLTSGSSLWPLFPNKATSVVTIGKLPGAATVTATLHRTRIPDGNNRTVAGGSGTEETNPSDSEAWKLQSILVYNVGEKEYVKSRTMLRIR